MGHVPRITAEEQNDWNLEQAVPETEKNFSTDLQLVLTETTNDTNLSKTLVCLERQQHEMIPEKYQTHRRKLSSRFSLVFLEDRILVLKNLQIQPAKQKRSCYQQNDRSSSNSITVENQTRKLLTWIIWITISGKPDIYRYIHSAKLAVCLTNYR